MTPTHPTTTAARPTAPVITIEGVVLARPTEFHSHSLWRTVKTVTGLVRFILANDAPIAPWLEPGQRVRLRGRLTPKRWHDGVHETLSVHHDCEILSMPLRNETPAPKVTPQPRTRLAAAASLIGALSHPERDAGNPGV